MEQRYVGNNKLLHYTVLSIFAMVIIGAFASHTLYHQFFHNAAHTEAEPTIQACPWPAPHTVHMSIGDKKFSPSAIVAKRCDELVITSTDSALHDPAFGPHEHHLAYPSFVE